MLIICTNMLINLYENYCSNGKYHFYFLYCKKVECNKTFMSFCVDLKSKNHPADIRLWYSLQVRQGNAKITRKSNSPFFSLISFLRYLSVFASDSSNTV